MVLPAHFVNASYYCVTFIMLFGLSLFTMSTAVEFEYFYMYWPERKCSLLYFGLFLWTMQDQAYKFINK